MHDGYHGVHPFPYPCSTCVPGAPSTAARSGPEPPALLIAELGLQSVDDSDGAVIADVRLTKGMLGLSVSAIRYFEHGEAWDGSDAIYMDLWAVSALGRLLDAGRTALWVQGGLGGTGSNQFDPLLGPMFGATLEHTPSPDMVLHGGGRYFALEQDLQAVELRAGLGVSFLSLGYRVLRFNVGPALHGPEFALRLRR